MSSYSLAQLSNINWSDMSDKSIKYVDDYFSLGYTQCRTRVTLSHSACNATRCSAIKLPKLNQDLDGKHPELKEKTYLFPKKRISKAPLKYSHQ